MAEPSSDPEDLRRLWDEMWVASGLEPEEREAAVAAIADSLAPVVAASIPQVVVVPEGREVLTDPALIMNLDGSVDIEDCVLYTPPFLGLTASHIHEGRAVPDGEGGWLIEEARQVGQGCVPAAMADEILADYDEYIQAFKDSGNPPDPNHPDLARTMAGTYLDAIVEGTQQLVDEGWYYESFDVRNPEIVDIGGSSVVVVRDCVEFDPRSGVFETNGTLIDGAAPTEFGETGLFEVRMRLEDGQWKVEGNEQVGNACDVAPTPAALRRI